MNATPDLEAPLSAWQAEEAEEDPAPRRYALQRVMAARLNGLPHQMLLRRAKSEGEAHRRSESAEGRCLPSEPPR